MNKIWLVLILISLGSLYPFPALGLGLTPGDNDGRNPGWYSSIEPDDACSLLDEGTQAGQAGRNNLWVINSDESDKKTSIEVPQGSWITLQLAPVADGELELYCLYPTGSTDILLTGQVRNGHSYRAFCQAEAEGDYEVWYSIDGSKSNRVNLKVSDEFLRESSHLSGGYAGGMQYSAEAMPSAGLMSYAAPPPSPSIGFSTGGAKDIANFRENIEDGYLPLPTDITYEGLFYDYYFDTGQTEECHKLFCPSYSYAISRDPVSKEPEYYLSAGLNSGITDFKRKKLNLVVVLDNSGSMGSPFDQYYYDRFGNRINLKDDSGRSKMKIADRAVVDLLAHLNEDDRFGMVIFSDGALIVDPLTRVGDKNPGRLRDRILSIDEDGSTNMYSGIMKGTRLFSRYMDADPGEYENRIIFLTDAMPNIGQTGADDLSQALEDNAHKRIHTTLIGIGVDFNTELIEEITKIRGANYYSVHSDEEFKKRMDDEFEYMVTPLVFDLQLLLDAPGYEIEKVYGSPEADESTGELMRVNTLFPSKAEAGQVRGGVILVKLKKVSSDGRMKLSVSYQDREGVPDSDEAYVDLVETKPDYYKNTGIRKAVLLTRYADLLKDWAIDEREAQELGREVVPTVTLNNGIVVPVMLGEWERQSIPLVVSEPYRKIFGLFGSYFEDESRAIGDESLKQEQAILEKLASFEESAQRKSQA